MTTFLFLLLKSRFPDGKGKKNPRQHQGNRSHSSTFRFCFCCSRLPPTSNYLWNKLCVSHMVELEGFRSLLSEEKQEKKGLAVEADYISASASCPRPWKMPSLLWEGLQSDARRQKQFGFLAVLRNSTRHSLVRFLSVMTSQVGDMDV